MVSDSWRIPNRVTLGEPTEETRTFGFAVEIGAPATRAAGASVYAGLGARVVALKVVGDAIEGSRAVTVVTRKIRTFDPSRHSAALLISGSRRGDPGHLQGEGRRRRVPREREDAEPCTTPPS